MPRIKDESVREVVAAADMVEVVSGRTALRRAGARFTGRCPFHEERTPSFSVNAVDKLFYCFGCGKGGDVITFVRETENLDFVGAVEWLAERFRIALEYEESSPRQEAERKRRDRLHGVLDQAVAFFERHLWETDAGAEVRATTSSRAASASRSRASSGSASRRGVDSRPRRARAGSRSTSSGRSASRTRAGTTTSRSG